jgi:hypothetical protein
MIPSLTAIHFLITYRCSAECDHCFIWGSPRRQASMTVQQAEAFLDQVASLKTVSAVCAEGGEPFTRYDVLLHFVRSATERGLKPSALTNASWATSLEEAQRRAEELLDAGLVRLGVSTDEWHRKAVPIERVNLLLEVSEAAGLPASRMETCIDGVMFRGRAAERLAPRMLTQPAETFRACLREHLSAPSRVHLDCYGRLHLCQGLCIGAAGPAEAIRDYDPAGHPIVRLLLDGGPYALAQFAAEHGFKVRNGYVDACHLCYRAREFMRSHFPNFLAPDEMYGDRPACLAPADGQETFRGAD